MARHSATIYVCRRVTENGESYEHDFKVVVEADFSFVSSYNPHERGYHIEDWWVVEPSREFQLDERESERAVAALYEAAQ